MMQPQTQNIDRSFKSSKEAQAIREKLAADTAAFIANGGRIKKLPSGPDAHASDELESQKKRKIAARKSGQAKFNNPDQKTLKKIKERAA